MSDARDPYEVLGVPRNATTRQIRAAYVSRARRAHPDLVGRRGLDVMRALNEAWAVLKEDVRRAEFDAANGRSAQGAAAGQAGAGSTGTRRDDPNAPFWTGAKGPPPGRPAGTVLEFGIYAGWSLGEISRLDPGYLMWLRDRVEGESYTAEIARLLNADGDKPTDARDARPGRRR
jgi:curved DNA-binding protein CbpA